jgi:hypothetical protein
MLTRKQIPKSFFEEKEKNSYTLIFLLFLIAVIIGFYFIFNFLYSQYLYSQKIDPTVVERHKIKLALDQYREVMEKTKELQYYTK